MPDFKEAHAKWARVVPASACIIGGGCIEYLIAKLLHLGLGSGIRGVDFEQVQPTACLDVTTK